jgi:hypothetical protein
MLGGLLKSQEINVTDTVLVNLSLLTTGNRRVVREYRRTVDKLAKEAAEQAAEDAEALRLLEAKEAKPATKVTGGKRARATTSSRKWTEEEEERVREVGLCSAAQCAARATTASKATRCWAGGSRGPNSRSHAPGHHAQLRQAAGRPSSWAACLRAWPPPRRTRRETCF